jgi:predicted RNA binding protein YcfA (HicA-like mRNA interferase family)
LIGERRVRKLSESRELPSISGKKLIKLAVKDGWIAKRRAKHGIALAKSFSDRNRVTFIPDTRAPLDEGTLSAIIGHKQMGIGKKGLMELIDKYGL